MNVTKIRMWLYRNQSKITWFIIGSLVTTGIRDLLVGNIVGALISFVIAFLNYVMAA